MQSPGLRLNAQSLRGTPVMMFLLEIVHLLLTWLFSIHTSELSLVNVISVKQF